MAESPRSYFSSPDGAGTWMASDGPDHDVVVTTRIRFARNLEGYPFRSRLSDERAKELVAHLRERLTGLELSKDQAYLSLDELEELDRELLFEHHLISLELARGTGPRGVFFSVSRHVSATRMPVHGRASSTRWSECDESECDEAVPARGATNRGRCARNRYWGR